MRGRWLLPLAAGLVMLGLAIGGLGERATPPATAASVATERTLPAGQDRPLSAWRACGGGFECATLSAPLAYADQGGPGVSIEVARLPATDPARRIGPLLMNPGGPGASAIGLLRSLGPRLAPEIRARFDLVAFEPRGVGGSTTLNCHDNLQAFIAADPSPDNAAEWATMQAVSSAFARNCGADLSYFLAHLGTRDVVQDMELLRRELGAEQISYLGYSYGTVIGSVYADMYPGRVRAFVLDGAFDFAGADGPEGLRKQSVGFERALDAFLAACAKPTCPLAANGDPRAALDGLLAKVEVAPIPAPGADRMLGPGEADLGVLFGLYAQSLWPAMASAVSQAIAGNGTALVELADAYLGRNADGSYGNLMEVYLAVSCLDYSWPRDPLAYESLAAISAIDAPHFGPANLLTSALPCATWAAEPNPLSIPRAAGAPPILVIATTNDPATPYMEGIALAHRLESGVLLTHEGEGHTVYAQGNACIDATVNAYILALHVPPDGSRCTADGAGPFFEPPPALEYQLVTPGISRGP